MTPRRRSFLLAGLALLLGGLAASDVAGREAALEQRLGPAVPVVVARADLAAGEPIPRRSLTVREVPARFAPRGAYAALADVAGQRPAALVPAGSDLTATALADPAQTAAGAPVRAGERVADVLATGSPDLVVPGARVDVLVTRESRPGSPGRTELALQAVEVLDAVPAGGADAPDAPAGPRVQASLRVTLRQAVFLTAAQAFAREIRLLPRPAGDREHAPPVASVG